MSMRKAHQIFTRETVRVGWMPDASLMVEDENEVLEQLNRTEWWGDSFYFDIMESREARDFFAEYDLLGRGYVEQYLGNFDPFSMMGWEEADELFS
jgi:hypothetical protein